MLRVSILTSGGCATLTSYSLLIRVYVLRQFKPWAAKGTMAPHLRSLPLARSVVLSMSEVAADNLLANVSVLR